MVPRTFSWMGIGENDEGKRGKPQASSLSNEYRKWVARVGRLWGLSHIPKNVGMTVGWVPRSRDAGAPWGDSVEWLN